ncbi:hypothetical protein M758_8G139100 [Ceratodon purpureus]|nr:hypothetical protein M758_8G139100 [Ceratodon purpureus]
MKAALGSFSLGKIPSILRRSSVWGGVCSDGQRWVEETLGRFSGGEFVGSSSGEGVRSFVATSSLLRSRIQSKYSRNEPKGGREVGGAGGGKGGGLVLGPGSKVRHGPNLAFKALNQTGLQESTKSVVLGSLLGDSTLHVAKGENDARLLFRISEADEEYFRWKAAALEEISSLNSVHLGASNKFLFRSRAVDSLTKIYEVTHSGEELVIRKRWLSHFTPQSLAVWWCDAGSLVAGGRKGELCTDPFSEDRVLVLSKYLEDEWKVHAHVGQLKSTNKDKSVKEAFIYRLTFRTEELKKFLRLVLPHIPVASMLRKCLVVNHSQALQESWISEMKAAVPHFATYIDEELLKIRKTSTRTDARTRASKSTTDARTRAPKLTR